jgi:hypothetical protein
VVLDSQCEEYSPNAGPFGPSSRVDIISLGKLNGDLPKDIDRVLALALAKSPLERFDTPVHQLTSPTIA